MSRASQLHRQRQLDLRAAKIRLRRETSLSPYQRHAVAIFESWGWILVDGNPGFKEAVVMHPETKERTTIPYQLTGVIR